MLLSFLKNKKSPVFEFQDAPPPFASDGVGNVIIGENFSNGVSLSLQWYPAIWSLIHTFNANVLGRDGIHPKFRPDPNRSPSQPTPLEEWLDSYTDKNNLYSPLDLARVSLTCLVLYNELWLYECDGFLEPFKPPVTILDGGRYSYSGIGKGGIYCSPYATPQDGDEPGCLHHFVIRWQPGQKRGISLFNADVFTMLEDRKQTIRSVVKLLKKIAALSIIHKRATANDAIDVDEKGNPKIVIDATKDNVISVPTNDEITSLGGNYSGPISLTEVDNVVLGELARYRGLSPLAVTGTYDQNNYAASKAAKDKDNLIYAPYQRIIHRIMRLVYDRWSLKPMYDSQFNGWFIPPFRAIEPNRQAAYYKIMHELGLSLETILESEGFDPEVELARTGVTRQSEE